MPDAFVIVYFLSLTGMLTWVFGAIVADAERARRARKVRPIRRFSKD